MKTADLGSKKSVVASIALAATLFASGNLYADGGDIGASAMLSSKLVTGATLKIYRAGAHALPDASKDQINEDLLAFFKSGSDRVDAEPVDAAHAA